MWLIPSNLCVVPPFARSFTVAGPHTRQPGGQASRWQKGVSAVRPPIKALLSTSLALLVLGLAAEGAAAQNRRNILVKRPGLYSGFQQEALGPGAARKCAGQIVPAEPGKGRGNQVDAISTITLVRVATPGCSGNPVVSTVGDSFYVDWTSDCVAQGDFVILSITSPSPWEPGGAAWKDQAGNTVDVASIIILASPALDARGGALLALALGTLGMWALRRRRPRPDAI